MTSVIKDDTAYEVVIIWWGQYHFGNGNKTALLIQFFIFKAIFQHVTTHYINSSDKNMTMVMDYTNLYLISQQDTYLLFRYVQMDSLWNIS